MPSSPLKNVLSCDYDPLGPDPPGQDPYVAPDPCCLTNVYHCCVTAPQWPDFRIYFVRTWILPFNRGSMNLQ